MTLLRFISWRLAEHARLRLHLLASSVAFILFVLGASLLLWGTP